jgi:hypothetical protein
LEIIVTLQSLSSSLSTPLWEASDRSLWQRLVAAIVAGRERRADREIAKYLRSRQDGHRDEFRLELERRFLGQ